MYVLHPSEFEMTQREGKHISFAFIYLLCLVWSVPVDILYYIQVQCVNEQQPSAVTDS